MLNLTKVALKNFCRHEHLELELKPGLSGLRGRNGAGKSSLANAICGAFTGTFPRHSDGAAGCIRQGSAGPCYVEVEGVLGGTPFRIRREITLKGIKHSLWLDGVKYSDKAKEIEAWIGDVSGLTPQIMSEFVFIGQQEVYSFLETTDGERSKKFAALCGTRSYEQLRDQYADYLKRDKANFEASGAVSITFLENAVASAEETLQGLSRAGEELSARRGTWQGKPMTTPQWELLRDRTRKSISDLEAALGEYESLQTFLETMQDTLAKDREALAEKAAFFKERKKKLAPLAEEKQRTREAYQEAKAAFLEDLLKSKSPEAVQKKLEDAVKKAAARNNILRLTEAEKETAEKCLREAEKIPDDLEPRIAKYASHLDKLAKETGSLRSELRQVQALQKMLEGRQEPASACVCPLCGSDTEHWKHNPAELKKREDGLERELRDIQEKTAEFEGERRELDEWQTRRNSFLLQAEQGLARAEQRESQLEADPPLAYDPEEKLRIFHEYRQASADAELKAEKARGAWMREYHEAENAKSECRILEANIASLEKNLSETQQKLQDFEGNPETIRDNLAKFRAGLEDLENRIRESRERDEQQQRLEGQTGEVRRRLEELRSDLEERRRLRDGTGRLQDWFVKMEKAVGWLKKDGLPRLIHRSILGQLVKVINAELELFDDPFFVEVNEDLTFTAFFGDGRVTNSKDLSGGEKVMLALSFWSALNRTFAANLGIMILDEPTAGLDRDNLQKFYLVAEQWKQLLHRRGQQVVVITHDEEMGIFDHVYHFGA
jgi:DNA repair exonuclease SbcCD ATPase subunit